MVLSKSLWRTSAVWRGTGRSSTSWPPPARVAGPPCGISARTTSSSKSATTATGCVPHFRWQTKSYKRLLGIKRGILFSLNHLNLNAHVHVLVLFFCFFLDALLWAGLEPRGGHSAGLGLGGRSDARHPDVGPAFRHLSPQDFRESHTVSRSSTKLLPSLHSFKGYDLLRVYIFLRIPRKDQNRQ